MQPFQGFGLPDWFRITIGLLEMLGGILLLILSFTGFASFSLSIIMIGAIGCHLLFDPISKTIPSIVFFVILTYLNIYFKPANWVIFVSSHY